MADERYNGWKNFETWTVFTVWTNEESSYAWMRGMAEDAYREAEATEISSRREIARYALADSLKDHTEESSPFEQEGRSDLYAALLTSALQSVDWAEIASHALTDDIVAEVDAEESEDS